MSEIIKSGWLYWKLAIFRGFNGWFVVTAMTIFATDIQWSTMTTWQKWRLIVMGFVAGAKYLEGFMDSTVTNIRTSRNPLGFDTAEFRKQDLDKQP